jgi:hypothetical protein
MLICFGMIWNYDKISKWNKKYSKICALSKKIGFSKFDRKKMTYWGNYK